jgi:putative transposase
MARPKKTDDPFRWFDSSPEVIRLVVMMSVRNVEDLLFERRINICHETVRLWWNRFGPMFAGEIRRKRVDRMRAYAVYLFRDGRHRNSCGGPQRLLQHC